jgi:nucleoside-diphosphate-sugar epimerase
MDGTMTKVLVSGAGGFIGGHPLRRLKREGIWVRGVDLKYHECSNRPADEFIVGDLLDPCVAAEVVRGIDLVFQPAAGMKGAGCQLCQLL